MNGSEISTNDNLPFWNNLSSFIAKLLKANKEVTKISLFNLSFDKNAHSLSLFLGDFEQFVLDGYSSCRKIWIYSESCWIECAVFILQEIFQFRELYSSSCSSAAL